MEAAVAYFQLLLTQPWKPQPRKRVFGPRSNPGTLKEEADSINTSQSIRAGIISFVLNQVKTQQSNRND